MDWAVHNVLGLLLLIVAGAIILLSRKKDFGDALAIGGIAVLGLIFAGLAISGAYVNVGIWASKMVFGSA